MKNDSNSFSDSVVSISELRSNRSGDAADWTPRDAIISMLRAIDRGEVNPKALVIAYCEDGLEAGKFHTRFYSASPEPCITVGMLEIVKLKTMGII
jgi:hypothetical protein